MKKILLPFLLISTLLASNNPFDDLDKEFGDDDIEFKNFKENVDKEFNTFKKSIDDEFSAFLKQSWAEFEASFDEKPYEKPKPKNTPIAKKIVEPKKEDIKKSPPVKIVKKEEPKPIQKTKPKIDENKKIVTFNFYGEKITINYDKSIFFNLSTIDNNSISTAWQTLGKAKLTKTKEQIENYFSYLSLNDWAKYLLIHKLAEEIYKDKNKANIFTWHLLAKLGFNMKVGYNKQNIYLLSSIRHKLFQIPFFTIDSKKYYLLSKTPQKIGTLYTYKGNYPKANNRLSFELTKPIKLDKNIQTKKLHFKFEGKSYSINAQYSKELVEFYNSFPQSDYNIYLDSKSSPQIDESILEDLKKYVKNMNELKAVNFLLRFTQNSFKYKTDDAQFNKEKVMFPDETVFYPYSDCEDRSIMFATLVKNLLGLKVVALKYPNHLATAVALSSKTSGDSFKHKGVTYTIADPTYINANAGMTMPQYKNTGFNVIE